MDASGIVLLILLGVMVVFMFLGSKRQRKAQEEQMAKLNELKEGDKVRTRVGIYATIKKIYDSTNGKIAVLEIGEGNNKVTFEMEMYLIYGLDTKTEVKFDEEATAQIDNKTDKKEEIKQEEIEKAKEDIKEKLEEQSENKTTDKKHADENDGNE